VAGHPVRAPACVQLQRYPRDIQAGIRPRAKAVADSDAKGLID